MLSLLVMGAPPGPPDQPLRRWPGVHPLPHQQQAAVGQATDAGQGQAVGTVVHAEGLAVVRAAQHAATIADQHQAAIIDKRSACQAELQGTARGLEFDRLPAVTEVAGAEQVAAKAVGQQGLRLGGADHAEQRALVGALDLGPGLAVVGGAEHAALLTHDEQAGIAHVGDTVQVQLVRVVQPLGHILPVLPTIGGFQQGTIGPHGKAVLGVKEGDIEQGRFTGEVFELLAPGGAAVAAGEDLRVMADGPATLVVEEKHSSEQLPGGYPGLGPGTALVVGEQNVAAITHHHQALAGMGGVDQQALAGLGRFGGVFVGGRGLGAVCPHPQCQCQHRAGCPWPGTTPGWRTQLFPHDCPLVVFFLVGQCIAGFAKSLI